MQERMQQSAPASNLMALMARRAVSSAFTMRASSYFPFLILSFVAAVHPASAAPQTAQETPASLPPQESPANWTDAEKLAMLDRVIANQKRNDDGENIYERIERKEIRRTPAGTPPEIKVTRNVPAGTGVDHLTLGPDGKPVDAAAYHAELEKLEHSLVWASEDGRAQREAYEKVEKRKKERAELIEATRNAFLFTFLDRELRGDRMLSKFRMEPNPAYKPTSRATSIFSRVRGVVWIDDAASELARVEVEVTDDISIGGFLAKIYKGSRFMQERYEFAPGLWFASYSQYDFDGRRLFLSFSVHERTFYSQYKRVGPPKEALAEIRAELHKPAPVTGDP